MENEDKQQLQKEGVLLAHFHEFYSVLMDLKNSAKSGGWVFQGEAIPEERLENMPENEVSSGRIFQTLVTLFERQEINAGKTGGEMGGRLYREALFIMAAMADEVFLTMDWAGQTAWSKFLLETKFFGSNAGGDIFYEKMDNILQDRDSVYMEVATMGLLSLSLGFRGRFHGVNDEGVINNYKKQLYSFIYNRQPDLTLETKKLFPESYLHTIKQDAKVSIPGLKKWYGFLIGLFTVLFGISYTIWHNMTSDISKIVLQILGQ